MKLHPEALRQIMRAMEKDLQEKMPATRATERKLHEKFYHKHAETDGHGRDRNDRRDPHDFPGVCSGDQRAGQARINGRG